MSRFYRYGWGWDFRLPFGWWLVYSFAEEAKHLYISNDATPPNKDFNKGVTLYYRRLPRNA